jgi:hypothetical protein
MATDDSTVRNPGDNPSLHELERQVLATRELTLERWLEITRKQWPVVSLGLEFLAFSDDELCERVRALPDEHEAFYHHLTQLIEWNLHHLEVMQGVQARLLCALARHADDEPADPPPV